MLQTLSCWYFNLTQRRHFSTGALSNALRRCKLSRYCHGINTSRDDIFNGGGNCLSAPRSHHLDLQPALQLMQISTTTMLARQLRVSSEVKT
jgi:hypothetical protein